MSKENSSSEDAAAVAASDAPANTRPKDPNADMYENRPKKIIRVVTVIAYLFSVSFAAILLSTYYIFLWEPPNPRLIERERLRADPEMQFLFADAPSSLEKKGNLELDRDYMPFQSRVTDYVDDPDEKQIKLNTMLIKLRYSLVEIMRAHNGSRSLEPTISDDLFVMVKEMLNSTKKSHENNSMPKYDKNIAKEKTQSVSNVDLPLKSEKSMNINVEKYLRNRTSRFLSTNVDNFRQNHSFGMNYFNNNNNRNNTLNNQMERIIARSGVSIESSLPRSSKFADNPELHHYSLNNSPAVKPWLYTMNSEGEGKICERICQLLLRHEDKHGRA
ncbi:uncharacterized protein LOC109862478 [Pseudomyrmex gracilis]|uniref:uncharacterized protein LOC109862478 n=1 Tax=Pseudomyrmex gracilis TaxID=219809 RepID=UPI000994E907|nr:uncharacterized protein LOC109862478 [Pseudomyrmex gracilis]